MNTQILYFTLALLCIWAVMSQFFDDMYITKFIIALMPNAEKGGGLFG